MTDQPCVRCGADVFHKEEHKPGCPVCKPGIAHGAEFQGNLRRPVGMSQLAVRVNDIGSAAGADISAPEQDWARPTPRHSGIWGSVDSSKRGANRTKGIYHGKKREP